MKQCLYGDATDNWLQVLKNPDDNVGLIDYKILDCFKLYEKHELLVLLGIRYKKLCTEYKFHASNLSILFHKIEKFLNTKNVVEEIGNKSKKMFLE